MNPALVCVAGGFHRPDALPQLIHALHPATQEGPLKDAALDFRHVEPTGMFGCIVKLQIDLLRTLVTLSSGNQRICLGHLYEAPMQGHLASLLQDLL